MAATNASSGSTCAGLDHGAGTTEGDGEAGTVKPPSKVHVCSREYLPFRKSGPARFHSMVAMCLDIGFVGPLFLGGRSEMSRMRSVGGRVVQHGLQSRHERCRGD